jgi:hypothetical protein
MDSAPNMISKGELYAELDMIERKKRNVIIFVSKELEDKNMNERREQDKRRVLDLFQNIGAKSKVVKTTTEWGSQLWGRSSCWWFAWNHLKTS